MTTAIRYSEDKLRELVLYVADLMKTKDSFGATLLNKVLYYADFIHYQETGSPITGAEYMHLKNGPVPRRMLPVLESLKNEHAIRIDERSVGGFTQKRVVALRAPNPDIFSDAELAQVRAVVKLIARHTAKSISDLTHTAVGWQATRDKETIPYVSAWLKREPLNEDDIIRAHQLAAV